MLHVVIALSGLVVACGDRAHFEKTSDPAFREMKRKAEEDYYAPYRDYGRPVHLLTDVEWGKFETRNRKPRACALPQDAGVEFYLFCYLRDDSPHLLAHFLRWYRAAGVDLTRRSRFVVDGNATAGDCGRVFDDYGVPRAARLSVDAYSSQLKVKAVNAYLETLPADAWLVYPDVDEFFAYPCTWGGRVLPVVDHMARQSVDGPVAASIIVDTTLKEHGWLRALAGNGLGASDAPWVMPGVDFVGGEMYDRVAKNWRLEECVPPPRPGGTRWTDADIGARSLFRQFPTSYRATGCLLHLRPFKHVLTRATCASTSQPNRVLRQFYESSHLTACFHEKRTGDPAGRWDRRPRPIHATTYAFAHFRFTADGARSLDAKRAAYSRAAVLWRNAHGGPDTDLKATATAKERAAYANLNHAFKAYKSMELLYTKGPDKVFAIRDEVQVVLHVACNEDRPFPKDADAPAPRDKSYSPETSGRLPDPARKRLLALLDAGPQHTDHVKKLAFDYFSTYFSHAKNATKSGAINKKLAAYQTPPPRKGGHHHHGHHKGH